MPGAVRKPKSAPAKEKPNVGRLSRTNKNGAAPSAPRRRRTGKMPLLPIRDQVYFPHMIFPLLVGREKSVRALEEAIAGSRQIMLVAQRRVDTEEPEPED